VTTVVTPPPPTVTTETFPTTSGTGTAPPTDTTAPVTTQSVPTTTFPLGSVLPATLGDGWGLSATDRRAANIELPAGFAYETAQAQRNTAYGQVVGIEVSGGASTDDVLADVEEQIGASSVGTLPLDGAQGDLFRAGGANLITFSKNGRVFVVLAQVRDDAVSLANALSAAA
jgi:hypothetical protein